VTTLYSGGSIFAPTTHSQASKVSNPDLNALKAVTTSLVLTWLTKLLSLSTWGTSYVLVGIFAVICTACATTPTGPAVQPTPAPLTANVVQPNPPVVCPPPPEAKFMALQPGERHATDHVGPDFLYPNRDVTSGLAATLKVSDLKRRYSDHCPGGKLTCTYSEDHRNVSKATRESVYNEYNVPAGERNNQHGEVDHFWPLCAGGSNDLKNLWYQPKKNEWNKENLGFKEKDWLEAEVCNEVKAGQLDPKEAYQKMTTDWVAYYHDMRSQSDQNVEDEDDE
jgi:hypothetical protein